MHISEICDLKKKKFQLHVISRRKVLMLLGNETNVIGLDVSVKECIGILHCISGGSYTCFVIIRS